MKNLPLLKEFRATVTEDGIVHLVFDMPGRTMNVFSNAAIYEIEAFATWLRDADVRGVVISSGKTTAFCAGADLGELGAAYDMIMAAPASERKRVARDHFVPIGRAFRKLETAGKPVAAAIGGLALGGGCEFAMGAHYRVMADTPQAALGLPESLVGLLPGGGGTQRMPRVVGIEKSLPILLEGARLSASEALAAGVADEVVPAGGEVAAAERWVRTAGSANQPWDRHDWSLPSPDEVDAVLAPVRQAVLTETGGHYPAPLAILECLRRGLPLHMDAALAEEIDIFADLIRRPEPRNMIRSMFLGRQDYDRRRKAGTLPTALPAFVAELRRAISARADETGERGKRAMAFAGFASRPEALPQSFIRETPWFESPVSEVEKDARALLGAASDIARRFEAEIPPGDRPLADYAAIREMGFPAYLGGPFAAAEFLA